VVRKALMPTGIQHMELKVKSLWGRVVLEAPLFEETVLTI
jgi:hypothetical protein